MVEYVVLITPLYFVSGNELILRRARPEDKEEAVALYYEVSIIYILTELFKLILDCMPYGI